MRERKENWKRLLALGLAVIMMCQPAMARAEEMPAADEENTTVFDTNEDVTVPDTGLDDSENDGDSAEISANIENDEADIPADENTEEVFTAEGEGEEEPSYVLQYQAHCQTFGWMDWVNGGELAGTTGKSKRMEALSIKVNKETVDPEDPEKVLVEEVEGAIEYRAHSQSVGWQDWVKAGEIAGTTGMGKRLEAIQIRLTGELALKYDVYYQVHCSRFGDMGWAKNGEKAGTAGYSRAIEAITILLVEKGSTAAPEQTGRSFLSPTEKGVLTYDSHVQTYGWLDAVADGAVSGTQGESKRMEAFRMYLANPLDESGNEIEGTIEYRAHSQTYGWMNWQKEGQIAGTTGQGKRLEAIQIRLTGKMGTLYDVYYRVHCSRWGTLGWAKNGEIAGTAGYYRSIESFEVILVPKGSGDAPVQDARSYLDVENIGALTYSVSLKDEGWKGDVGNKGTAGVTGQSKTIEALKMQIASGTEGSITGLYSGGITYKVYAENTGWQAGKTAGETAGEAGSGNRLEAVQIQLTGELAQYCDVYYRAHVQAYGWLGWAKNGQSAGTTKCSYRMEALQVCIVPKTAPAPGSNTEYYKDTKKPVIKKISEFSTNCTSAYASFFNMTKALAEFNGLVVQPGQTVSFFGVAGPCGKAQGYMAGGVVGGVGYGGGICQASTTLYGAALRAGMTIVERRNHSVPSTYVPIGQDAMVNYGTSDFKFRNDFSFPVTLVTWTEGKTLHAEFWGQDPGWFDSVKVNSWYTGSRSAAAERVFYKNGVEVKREALSNSYY